MSTPTLPTAPDTTVTDVDATAGAVSERRTYLVRTLGCQMNVHDSEHMAGMLEQAGYTRASSEDEASNHADVVVINTCAVRENAATRLYGNLGQLAGIKSQRPGMQIAVGGCLAQKDRGAIVEKAPWVDVVFGTHNLDALPVLLERARHNERAEVEIAESLQVFPSTLPTRRESVYAGWVSISVGCNNTCTFCIVPHLRGKERDRRPGEILAEVEALVAAGAVEVTLLGQNVNSYGVEFGDRGAFAKLLRACGGIEGLERVRFTSPHPAAFTDDVIDAMAETPNVMPQLHMPLQSGSDRILRAMRRSYRSAKFLGILDRVRAAMPDAAITTDIIVGFPGETEEDFAETLRVVEQARFSSAFMFQYSQRPGTPAATMEGQLPKEVVQERFERLLALQERISAEESQEQIGRTLEVLVAEGAGRKDGATHRLSGRARDNRLVHFALPGDGPGGSELLPSEPAGLDDPRLADVADLAPGLPRPGDTVTVTVTHAAPHHLIADSATGGAGTGFAVRRTRSGDAWAARERARLGGGDDHHGHGAPAPGAPVTLGMPTIGPR
ncbi:tRNA (N6-isopentenyl adenosine(37)-C2)-methylthiotransferase MiaB [Myceligenerans salitolerans]|uniref:tRNA-2-methylthio-N(6)-dimethylallyladenosine synthase n=1 Tax=Myceligenerans salitolerans TaxID=1230528 RepID=A0ABS3I370_9MICO|nr:tRNA (N6-isopentenyl adenosine(37)-C2)-methylthiotransferase MiaB [Myceligenerans salitolerans]MBO0607445.1 tRNA (N6-isopentenyl adenosine(37)-C2)-methylthiotransferase MiaB [Myceligenerans salitolerans]